MATAIQRLAQRLHEMIDDRASRAHVERFKVLRVAPLLVEQVLGDLVLEDGDPDFDISDAVAHSTLHVGDVVLVSQTTDEDWIAVEAIGGTATSGGGGGGGTTTSGVPVFVQETEPTDPAPWVWYEVDGTGTLVTVWVST